MPSLRRVRGALKTLLYYKSGLVGLVILLMLVALAVHTVLTYPYEVAVMQWKAGEKTWLDNPRYALPEWLAWLMGKNLPRTIILSTYAESESVKKIVVPVSGNMSYVLIEMKGYFASSITTSNVDNLLSWVRNLAFRGIDSPMDLAIIWGEPPVPFPRFFTDPLQAYDEREAYFMLKFLTFAS